MPDRIINALKPIINSEGTHGSLPAMRCAYRHRFNFPGVRKYACKVESDGRKYMLLRCPLWIRLRMDVEPH